MLGKTPNTEIYWRRTRIIEYNKVFSSLPPSNVYFFPFFDFLIYGSLFLFLPLGRRCLTNIFPRLLGSENFLVNPYLPLALDPVHLRPISLFLITDRLFPCSLFSSLSFMCFILQNFKFLTARFFFAIVTSCASKKEMKNIKLTLFILNHTRFSLLYFPSYFLTDPLFLLKCITGLPSLVV